MNPKHIIVSCWNEHGGVPGMALLNFNNETGELSLDSIQNEDLSCNCSVYNESNKILYITNEVHNNPDYPKGGGGLIYAFKFDDNINKFNLVSKVESSCPCPAYLSLDKTKKYLLCANHSSFNAVTKAYKGEDGYWHTEVIYDDAIVSLFRLNEDGSIGPMVDVKKHDQYKVLGRGLHAHPHSANMTPDGRFHVVCDKGDSHIYFYKIDYTKEELLLSTNPYNDNEGASPRYCAFHPNNKWLFVNHERDLHVTSFSYDSNGSLTKINSCEAIANVKIPDTGAVRKALHNEEVDKPKDGIWPLEQQGFVISPDGKYLYDAINGGDSISVLKINQDNGNISLIQTVPINGRWVRGVNISPNGKFVIACCLQSGGVYSFKVNADGTLGHVISHVDIFGCSYITFI